MTAKGAVRAVAGGSRHQRPVRWSAPAGQQRLDDPTLLYTGPLARHGTHLVLHAGFDGWQDPRDLEMERLDRRTWTVEVPDAAGRHVVDCVIKDGDEYDNNGGANYRLWVHLDPVDSHVHARVRGQEPMGFGSLTAAFYASGMTHALISWQSNSFVDRVSRGVPWLSRLVWVRPRHTKEEDVRRRLAGGAVGLKLHPSYDNYPADSTDLDPHLQAAADADVPVTVHSGPAFSDPDLIRRLAERFPQVPFVLYHTYLGPEEGRARAARHAQELPNVYLETSWCRSGAVEQFIDVAGPERVLFGSDAAIDGPWHYNRTPPNIEMAENYNDGLLLLAQKLDPDVTRLLLEGNTRRLFGLDGRSAAPGGT